MILLITMLGSISVSGSPKNNFVPMDSTKSEIFEISKEELIKTRMIIEENKSLRKDIQDFKRIDTMQFNTIQSLQDELINCEKVNELKEQQLRKSELTPRVVTVVESEPWYKTPFFTALGFAAGVATGYILLKK